MLNSQPLHVIASGVASKKAVVLTSARGNFKTLRELTECMRASMLLPGITGPMVRRRNDSEEWFKAKCYRGDHLGFTGGNFAAVLVGLECAPRKSSSWRAQVSREEKEMPTFECFPKTFATLLHAGAVRRDPNFSC